jgi:hypothetical protein
MNATITNTAKFTHDDNPTPEEIAEAKTNAVLERSHDLERHWGVELVGVWVWVTNTQRQDATALKELGLKWSPKKSAWYWANKLKKGRKIYAKDLDTLRNIHGTTKR